MENSHAKYAITYGRTDFHAEEGLRTIFVKIPQEVSDMALHFINVIPDELTDYVKDIMVWYENAVKGDDTTNLVITHQDDDTFLFMATPIGKNVTMKPHNDFDSFVGEFFHPRHSQEIDDV